MERSLQPAIMLSYPRPSNDSKGHVRTPYPGTELFDRARQKGFTPPDRLEKWADHTLRKFHAPWTPDGIRWRLEYFANVYLPLVDYEFDRHAPSPALRSLLFIIDKLFFPFVWLRFSLNCFRAPLEAALFLRILHLYNRLTGTNYTLGPESYVHRAEGATGRI